MSIVRDDRDERQTRLEWTIDEFKEAQRQRLVKANERAIESQVEADTKAALTGSGSRDELPSSHRVCAGSPLIGRPPSHEALPQLLAAGRRSTV